MTIRALVWNENIHERTNPLVAEIYPDGIHQCIADGLNQDSDIQAETATLEQPEHGLTQVGLAETDVLLWWGHKAHGDVDDAIVDRVQQRIWEGMGLIVLHSGHFSKILRRMLGTPCALKWREAGERERLWVINPTHPIVDGIPASIELENAEMYGEPFSVPEPDETVFVSWFEGGEVFRSGMTWKRGGGKIFYFRPGHETYPIYHNQIVQKILKNAVRWANSSAQMWATINQAPNVPYDEAPEHLEEKGPKLHAAGEEGYR